MINIGPSFGRLVDDSRQKSPVLDDWWTTQDINRTPLERLDSTV